LYLLNGALKILKKAQEVNSTMTHTQLTNNLELHELALVITETFSPLFPQVKNEQDKFIKIQCKNNETNMQICAFGS